MLRNRMRSVPVPEQREITKRDPITEQRQKALFQFYEKDVEDRINQLLPEMALALFVEPTTGKSGRQYVCAAGRIDLLCKDTSRDQFVIVELKKGQAPNETLLQILRYMSWVRQNLSNGREARGIILTESADANLADMLYDVPNVSISYYRVTLELVPNAR